MMKSRKCICRWDVGWLTRPVQDQGPGRFKTSSYLENTNRKSHPFVRHTRPAWCGIVHYVGCVCMCVRTSKIDSRNLPFSSAFITPSLQPTFQRIHTTILLQYHIHFYTTIRQTSNIVNQWMYCFWSWEIGFTTVDIIQLAHVAGEYIFTTFGQYT